MSIIIKSDEQVRSKQQEIEWLNNKITRLNELNYNASSYSEIIRREAEISEYQEEIEEINYAIRLYQKKPSDID